MTLRKSKYTNFLYIFQVLSFCVEGIGIRSLTARSNHKEVFYIKVFLKISQNSLENTWVGFSFLVKLQNAILFKKKLWQWWFFTNFVKLFRNNFFIENLLWLLRNSKNLQSTDLKKYYLFRFLQNVMSLIHINSLYLFSPWYSYSKQAFQKFSNFLFVFWGTISLIRTSKVLTRLNGFLEGFQPQNIII